MANNRYFVEFDPIPRHPYPDVVRREKAPTKMQSGDSRYVLLIGTTPALRDTVQKLGGKAAGVNNGMQSFTYGDVTYMTETIDVCAGSSPGWERLSLEAFHLILFAVSPDDTDGCRRLADSVSNLQHYASWISALVLTGCDDARKSPRDFVCEFRAEEQGSKNRLAAFTHKGILTIGQRLDHDDLHKLAMESGECLQTNRLISRKRGRSDIPTMSNSPLRSAQTQPQSLHQHGGSAITTTRPPINPPTGDSAREHTRRGPGFSTTASVSPRPPLNPRTGDSAREHGGSSTQVPRPLPKTPQMPPTASNSLTVLALGKVGSGKKTIGRQIAGKDIFASLHGAYDHGSMTRTISEFQGVFELDGVHIKFQTVDTESLNVGYQDPLQVVMNKLSAIDLILFVVPHGRYTDESHASLTHALQNLSPQASAISALVITHCDGMMEDKRKNIASEFRSGKRTQEVASFMAMDIHTVGFPKLEAVPAMARPIFEQAMATDAQNILRLVKSRIGKPSVPISMLGVCRTTAGKFNRGAVIPGQGYSSMHSQELRCHLL